MVQVLVKNLVDFQIQGFGLTLHPVIFPRPRVQLRSVFCVYFTDPLLLNFDELSARVLFV